MFVFCFVLFCVLVCLFVFVFLFVCLFVCFLSRFIVPFVLSAIKTNNVWALYLVMTGLSLSLCSCDPGICWLCYGLYTSPKSPIPRAFHKHYKQTNDKLKVYHKALIEH